MIITTAPDYDREFPAQRYADVTVVLHGGRTQHRSLTTPVLGAARTAALHTAIRRLPTNEPLQPLHDALFTQP